MHSLAGRRKFLPLILRLHLLIFLLVLPGSPGLAADTSGSLVGTVSLQQDGSALARAGVLVVELKKLVETNSEGVFHFPQLPPGRYTVVAHVHPLTDERKTVEIVAGQRSEVSFAMRLAPVRQEITVTASGREEATLEAFQSVRSLDALDLTPRASTSIGEALEYETGVAKRSFGPGTGRPVIRGFDGDRVSILQDGMPTGTLSSQSADHGEPFDVTSVERVEVVRGPATLLYGSNAMGGVVNVLTGHHEMHQHAHEGVRGFLTGVGGTGNAQGGGSAGFDIGMGNWTLFGGGGAMRTGDFRTPIGMVENSHTRLAHTNLGLGRYGERGFFRASYGVFEGRYGVPLVDIRREDHDDDHDDDDDQDHDDDHAREHDHEGPVDLKFRRQIVRFTGGVYNLSSAIERFTANVNYTDWNHRELVEDETHTRFYNKILSYRGVFDQQRRRGWSGSFGFNGHARSYEVLGEEALAPAVNHNSVAGFALQQFDLERVKVQLGGRVENNRYSPRRELRPRNFTGFSGSAGLNAGLWHNGAIVATFSHSYRAPAIEELYNYGPHPGNLTFEIGNFNLRPERTNGVETSLRHQTQRIRGEMNFFYYRISDFVYLEPTGQIEDGFVKALYAQGNSRYMGTEARFDTALHRNLWLKLGLDAVNAELRTNGTPLPRIPPVRGRIGVEGWFRGFILRPELLLVNSQTRTYIEETPTPGFVVANLLASYSITRSKALHSFGVNFFNAGDRLYRNHVSLIKDYVPEIGRGVRFSYTVRFF
jgi:iron complex outermembrane recepter protein